MKIAITSTGTAVESPVDERFGRCRYFSIYDVENETCRTVANKAQFFAEDAGVETAHTLSDMGINVVLAVNIGTKAYQALRTVNIVVITGITGTVAEALEEFSKGDFWPSDKPTVQPYSGMNKG